MDVFKTHGAFSLSELMTGDPTAAAAFYGPLFGWRIETMDIGGKVVVPAMDVPGVGRMAVIAGPQGAALSVMQYMEA